jgi:Zn-dependent M28 family amino/carboxypeptidase
MLPLLLLACLASNRPLMPVSPSIPLGNPPVSMPAGVEEKPGVIALPSPTGQAQPPQAFLLRGAVLPAPWLPSGDPWRTFRDLAQANREHIYGRLVELCDGAGHRLAGSPGQKRAEAIGKAWFEQDGIKVWTEPVRVPVWIRGEEELQLVKPRAEKLDLLALGGTVATPKEGVEAAVVVIRDFAELGPQVKGKIVLYNHPMLVTSPAIDGYGDAVAYRGQGASKAAKFGAVGVLVRSVTTHSLATPHTGGMGYEEGVAKIPAAAITVEDAERLSRLVKEGEVRVRLRLTARFEAEADAVNVIAELPGLELPGEVVVLGGHLDSWDVGQGAHDDGAGIVESVEALRLVKGHGSTKRTVRVVLFANEENGLRGAKAYFAAHSTDNHIATVETDLGGGRPRGWGYTASEAQAAWLLPLLGDSGMFSRVGGGGADISPLTADGVLGIGLIPDDSQYFNVHHTRADTVDKVDPSDLADATAAVAALVWELANAPDAPEKAAPRPGE